MLLQQYSRAGPNSREVLQPTTTRDLGEERRWERKGGRVSRLVVTTTCDADAHVRSGGEGLKSLTPTLNPSVSHGRQCGAMRCSPRHSGSLRFKTGNLGLPKRGAGNLRANLGVPPVSSRPGRAASGPGHGTLCYAASLDARLLNPPWMQISVPPRNLEAERAEAQTWTYFIAGSKR